LNAVPTPPVSSVRFGGRRWASLVAQWTLAGALSVCSPIGSRSASALAQAPFPAGRGAGPSNLTLLDPNAQVYPSPEALPEHPEMPDPLIDDRGRPVTTPLQWMRRRSEMRAILEHYSIGHMPPAPLPPTAEVMAARPVLGGHAEYRLVRLAFGPKRSLGMIVALYLPTEAPGPLPIFVYPTFTATPGSARPEAADARYKDVDPEAFASDRADVLRRGYGLLTYYYQEAALDRSDNRSSGFFPAYPAYDWGTLAAWAWGISRCVDYLSEQPFADARRIAVAGHSRVGKAVLIAAAFDDRIALAIPAGSGCGGTGAFRVNGAARQGKEGLEEITRRFPYWFGPHLPEFSGHVQRLPFDQHWFVALAAPRPLLMAEAFDDASCNGNASVATFRAAQPSYGLAGGPTALGLHFRSGGHAFSNEDWRAALDFADLHFRGESTQTNFQQTPEASLLK